MRDINRIEPLLDLIESVWKRYPDLRLGQLILNVAQEDKLYYLEDADLKMLLEERYKMKEGK